MANLPRHGTQRRYGLELREGKPCEVCREANAAKQRRRRALLKQEEQGRTLHIVEEDAPAVVEERGKAGGTGRSPRRKGLTEQAVERDLQSVPVSTPFRGSLAAAALVLAQQIDDPNSRAAKGPLVKQLVETIRELRGEGGGAGDAAEQLLRELAAPLDGGPSFSDSPEPGEPDVWGEGGAD